MATWTFSPQGVVEETFEVLATQQRVAPTTILAGQWAAGEVRRFRLHYDVVASATAGAMAAFFTARSGAWEAFDWTSPVDGLSYRVRFDGSLNLETFLASLQRTGGDLTFVVAQP